MDLETHDKMLKRAGLDYWKFVIFTYHDSIEAFFEATNGEYYLLTKFGKKTIVILIFQIMTKIFTSFLEKENQDHQTG